MDNLFIEPTKYTPEINFNTATGILSISGDCFHEYTTEFFQPVFAWLKEYFDTPGRKVVFNFKLDYFNTSTSRRFQEILNMLEQYQTKKKGQVLVNWYYDKNSLENKESGEEFAEFTKVKFNLVML